MLMFINNITTQFFDILDSLFFIFVFLLLVLIIASPVIALLFFIKIKTSNFGFESKHKLLVNVVFSFMVFVSVIFYYLAGFTVINKIDRTIELKRLSKYDSVINYLEDYKAKHGEYPKTLDFSKLKKDGYEYESYEALNNNKDYIIQVSNYEGIESYNYCSNPSNPDYEQCRPQIKYPMEYTAFGKWIYAQNHD